MPRYSNEQILAASSGADSIMAVMRALGIRETGGSHQHIKRRMLAIGIDVQALSRAGRRSNAGKKFPYARRSAASILIKRTSGRRQYSHYLRRSMIESGVSHECVGCCIGPRWRGKPLALEVDHKNNDWLDDRLENLQFLCPNCHSTK